MKRRFIADERGVSAVEFALILPFMVYLYFGAVELLEGVAINRQVALTSTTVATVVSQYTTISASSQLPDILNASVQIMQPYTTSSATVVVSAIAIDNTGRATVSWSQALNGSARSQGQVVSVPSQLDIANTTLILSETSYAYTPVFDFIHMGTKTLTSSVYMVPRNATTINLAS
jgi:Flp pilus assembly protein TadG